MKDKESNSLRSFIIAYIVNGHTATEESIKWIKEEIDRFIDNRIHGLKYGYLMPLVLCMQRIQCKDDPNEYSSFFTLMLERLRFIYTLEHHSE